MRFAARNLASNYAVYAAAIAVGIVLTPVIVRSIGTDGYGIWVFIGSVTVFFRLLDLGLAPSLVRYSAYHRGREDPDAVSAVASCGFFLYLGLSTLIALGGVVFAWFLPSIESIHGSLVGPARLAALVTILSLAVELPLGTFGNVLKGQQRFDVLNVGALLSLAVYAALIGVLLTRHGSVVVLAAIAFVATLVRVSVPALLVRRELPSLTLSPALVTRARVRELLSFSGYAFAGQIAGKIVFSADAVLIGIFLGSVPVAIYGVASRLFALASGMSGTGTDLLFPAYSELEGRGDAVAQQSYVVGALRGSMCMVVLVTAPMLALPGWIIRAWLPGGFEGSRAPLVLLAATLYFSQPIAIMAQFMLGRGRPREVAHVQIPFGLVNLALTSTLLVVVGEVWVAALSTLLLEGIVAVVVLPIVVSRQGIRFGGLVQAWLQPVAAGLLAAAAILVPAAVLWHGSDSLPGILAVGALWTLVFVPTAWKLALDARERAFVQRLIGRGGPVQISGSR